VVTRFVTVARPAQAEIEVRRSRFLCTVRRVDDESAARALVDALRAAHRDARHHCSAFVLGPDGAVERSSDDGEPSGTAGAPMLDVLRGAALTDVVAVVTRWFGGTLLGAGGLVRAYGDAVRAGVEAAGLLAVGLVEEWELDLDHADAARVENELRRHGHVVLGVEHAARVRLRLGVGEPAVDAFRAVVAASTAGAVEPVRVGERWVDLGPP
jgi:uncharacterized YigZ family protein